MLIITLLLLDLLKEHAYAADASVYCPDNGFMDNTVTNLTGSFNSSVLTTGKCIFGVTLVNFIFIRGTSNPVLLCRQTFSTSPQICNTTFSTQNCKCDNVTGEMFYYTYRFTTNANVHDGGVIELKTDCIDNNGENPLTNETCTITIPTTTTASTTTSTTTATTTTIYTSETTTKVPTTPPPPSFPDWGIAVIVIGIVLLKIFIVVCIIKKCKKEKQRGNRFHCCSHKKRNKRCCPCGFYPKDESSSNHVHIFHCCSHKKCNSDSESSSSDESSSNNVPTRPPAPRASNRIEIPTITPAAQDGKKWTESIPTTAPGGNNWTEQTIQDAKEMQDRNKHLGTDNSPEREKRRKKKKKKKTFQEVDGEPVSGEDKSTVNDHKAAQNDNSIYVTESSHGIDNGGHRSLPMPKLSHLTSVERNSTIFQSETPRKLPPLQLKQ